MPAYLLTWNPDAYPAHLQLDGLIRNLAGGKPAVGRWSCNRSRRPRVGDRIFLLRQRKEPRGIVGFGYVAEPPYEDLHWDLSKPPGSSTLYVQVRWSRLRTDPFIPRAFLDRAPFSVIHWDPRGGGTSVRDDVADALEEVLERID